MNKPKRKVAMLDRDGVLNKNRGYVGFKKDFKWIKGAKETIKKLKQSKFYVAVITNQSGIARGKYTEDEFLKLSSWIKERFFANGVNLTRTYYCPHHPDFGNQKYKKVCLCRKPGSLLFNQAQEDFNIDMKASIMIGDKLSDLVAAKNAGVGNLLLFSNNINSEFETIPSLSAAMGRL